MEVEWALNFDGEHDEQNQVFLYRLSGNDRIATIFDSNLDHDADAFRTYWHQEHGTCGNPNV